MSFIYKTSDMEQRITSLLLPAPEAELEASCKELDEKVTWLLHNSRKMDNYLELEPFSKDGRLCAHVCDTLKSLPETPTLAAYKDYKAIIILLGMSTTHYAILDELAEQHRKRDDIPELTAYCDALHWMRPGRPMQRIQHGMPRFPPAAEKPGKGQPPAGDGKGAAPRRTDAAGTGQADVHRNGTSERLHGL
jgi:hypothetical protein